MNISSPQVNEHIAKLEKELAELKAAVNAPPKVPKWEPSGKFLIGGDGTIHSTYTRGDAAARLGYMRHGNVYPNQQGAVIASHEQRKHNTIMSYVLEALDENKQPLRTDYSPNHERIWFVVVTTSGRYKCLPLPPINDTINPTTIYMNHWLANKMVDALNTGSLLL